MGNLDYNESKLLANALIYEQGHERRTRHLTTVYAISNSLGTMYGLSKESLYVLRAAAILHDLPIKLCKEKYQGDACQANQQKEAPILIKKFLKEANYPKEFYQEVLSLVLAHHQYDDIDTILLQLLIEADLIVNLLEEKDTVHWELAIKIIKTKQGKALLESLK